MSGLYEAGAGRQPRSGKSTGDTAPAYRTSGACSWGILAAETGALECVAVRSSKCAPHFPKDGPEVALCAVVHVSVKVMFVCLQTRAFT